MERILIVAHFPEVAPFRADLNHPDMKKKSSLFIHSLV
jgi:hypothetical protein